MENRTNRSLCQGKNVRIVLLLIMPHFGDRLAELFAGKKQREVAHMLGVTDGAVRHYFAGRMPDLERLQLISKLSGVNLHWLLTGKGEKFQAERIVRNSESFEDVLERRVREIVREEMSAVQDLGTLDDFNVEAAVKRLDNPHLVLAEWFAFEGRPFPDDAGVLFADGWEGRSLEEKTASVESWKKAIERSLKK